MPQSPIEVKGGADQAKVRERLREVSQSLTLGTSLLRVQPEMICKPQHSLEEKPCLVKPVRIRSSRSGERFDKPERAHIEGAFLTRQAIGVRRIAIDQSVSEKAALRRRSF